MVRLGQAVRDAVLAAGVLYVLCQVAIAVALQRVGSRAGLPAWFSPLAVLLLTALTVLGSTLFTTLANGIGVFVLYSVIEAIMDASVSFLVDRGRRAFVAA